MERLERSVVDEQARLGRGCEAAMRMDPATMPMVHVVQIRKGRPFATPIRQSRPCRSRIVDPLKNELLCGFLLSGLNQHVASVVVQQQDATQRSATR